ncbi:MAG: PAS domain S-box protein [Chloroflexi bacterium]|nr:PAS domain S-box protein [Chloroflexota bacterium]
MLDSDPRRAPVNEALFQRLLENSLFGMYLIQDGRFVYVNTPLASMLGYRSDELIGFEIVNFIHPDDHQMVAENLRVRLEGKVEVLHYTLRGLKKDGTITYLEVLGQRVEHRGRPAVLGTLLDITERTLAETALKKRTEQLRLLYEASRRLSQSLDPAAVYDALYQVVAGVMDCDILLLSEYNPHDNLIRCVHMRYEGQVKDPGQLPPIPLNPEGHGTQSVAIRTGQSLLLNDYIAHLQTSANVYRFNDRQVTKIAVPDEEDSPHSALIVPLKLEGEVVGVIQVFSYRLDAYTDDDLWLLEALAAHVVVVSHNAVLYGQIQDELAERRRIEESLRASEEKFRVIFNESPDVILIINETGFIQSANHAARTLLGYDETQLIGQPFSGLLPAGEKNAPFSWVFNPVEAGARLGSSNFRRADGSTLPIDWTANRIGWESGWAWLLTLRDASERRLLEEERLKAEMLHLEIQKERELIELREQFISMISHEFRNPLAVILSSSELLERYRHHMAVERQIEHLHEIQHQVQNMSEMIEDILKISKARAGKIKFNPAPLDANEFCRVLLKRLQETAGPRHRLVFTSDGEYTGVLLDEKLLSHILMNLLTNAIKYSPQGGEVRLSLSSADGYLIFQVSDEGIGIPAADQERLFKPFQRATNVGEIEGTGLGLAVVKDNLDLHGGTITVESQEGVGTIFTIWLPCQAAAAG